MTDTPSSGLSRRSSMAAIAGLALTPEIGAAQAATQAAPGLASGPIPAPIKLRHGYVDCRYGQLHFSTSGPANATRPPLVFFHQSPNSSVEYDALVAEIGKDRPAIAFDTPGHGGSHGPDQPAPLQELAATLVEGLKGLGYGPDRPVDIFGNHTGSKIATEMAVTEPRLVRKVAMSGVFLPPDAVIQKMLSELVHPASAAEMLDHLAATLPEIKARYAQWQFPDLAWGHIVVDSLRPLRRREFGHVSAFNYAPFYRDNLARISQPVLLVPLDDGLGEMTRGAKALLKKAPSVTVTETFPPNGFFTHAAEIAAAVRKWQDAA